MAVHAISQPCRLRAILEYVSKMRFTIGAPDLGSDHEEGTVFVLGYRIAGYRFVKARPACTRIKLCGGLEKILSTANAGKGAHSVFFLVWTRKSAFSSVLPGNVILIGCELCPPLFVGFFNFCHLSTAP